MITINPYFIIDKHNDQLQDKEQIQCKIWGRQSSVQEEWTFWDITVCWMIKQSCFEGSIILQSVFNIPEYLIL
jgi:hypothetical protein